MTTTVLTLGVFVAVYVGMALGRWPGLKVDRSGIAVLGAILLYASSTMSGEAVLRAIDFPTLIVLFGLMILSAEFGASGFYDWCSARISASPLTPAATLGVTIAVAGLLSAVLANDIVVFAMTPMLIRGIERRGLDARPYLIALACAANTGSAATLIGNPQNILIGQVGQLEFWDFAFHCAPPAVFGLIISYAVIRYVWRDALRDKVGKGGAIERPPVDRTGIAKASAATVVLLVLFATPLPHVSGILMVAALLLISRRRATQEIFRLVDWPLLLLFGGLFIVTASLAATGLAGAMLDRLHGAGIDFRDLPALAVVTLAGSNTIGNVPLVMLLLALLSELPPETLYALAALSTLAGNLLVVGSIANIIVVERAKQAGVALGFAEHARCGVPVTLLSFGAALAWFAFV